MELWDALDPNGETLGYDLVRGQIIPKDVYHLVVEALIVHTDGSYLIVQRCMQKDVYPGIYESSAGGSVLKGETSIEAIKREVFEEVGIDDIQSIRLLSKQKLKNVNSLFHTYIITTSIPKDEIVLQVEETMDYIWLSRHEYIKYTESLAVIPNQIARLKPYIDTIKFED
ncbi:MAG: NUDIX domain-containing protein [Erysipelothrix sp.]|nr:NUDIX domain-containing protein [Erysipelothrix sp.]